MNTFEEKALTMISGIATLTFLAFCWALGLAWRARWILLNAIICMLIIFVTYKMVGWLIWFCTYWW